jgi:hypothetical protein
MALIPQQNHPCSINQSKCVNFLEPVRQVAPVREQTKRHGSPPAPLSPEAMAFRIQGPERE